jgi:long-subunit fatty acid transport protein
MSPLLPDGDRDFYSAGLGFISKKNNWGFDIGYEYLDMEERSTEGRSYDGFDGLFYDGGAHLFGASFFWKF